MRKWIILLFAGISFSLASCSSTKPTQQTLIGTWESGIAHGTTKREIYEFRRDGTYTHTVPISSEMREYEGSYSVESGNLLVLTGDMTRGLTAWQFFFKDDNLNMVVSTTSGSVVATYKRASNQ